MVYTKEYQRFLLTTNRPEVRALKLRKLAGEPVDLSNIKEVRVVDLNETEIEKLVAFMLSLKSDSYTSYEVNEMEISTDEKLRLERKDKLNKIDETMRN